jgi:NAD+ synthase (glutamine-hydrolysing)
MAYVDQDRGFQELLNDGFDPDLVRRVLSLVDKAEYKRRQYPPGTKVSSRAFGKDRRLPMTSGWSEK